MTKPFSLPDLPETPWADEQTVELHEVQAYAVEYGQAVAAAYALYHANVRAEFTILVERLGNQANELVSTARRLDAEQTARIARLEDELSKANAAVAYMKRCMAAMEADTKQAKLPHHGERYDPWRCPE